MKLMGRMGLLAVAGRALNTVVSVIVFSFLDLLDAVLCFVYKIADFAVDREWKACYCSISSSGDIFARGGRGPGRGRGGRSNVLRLCPATNCLHLDSISDTLHFRPYLVSDLASIILKKYAAHNVPTQAILEIPSRKTKHRAAPRWSDCDCHTCNSWSTCGESQSRNLYVRAEGNLLKPEEDVVFIHGFISSSGFWTETVFEEFSEAARSKYRLLAVDLLGFGRSPKPDESLYTMTEHVEMIERSVLRQHGVRRFHIVAHSLGSVLALALAARHPDSVISLTLLAPPYFPGGEGDGGQAVMRRVAPRRVWPPMVFAASMACWYEHVSRTICLVICRQHRLWNYIFRLLTLNRIRTFLIEGFMCHTHNAAWHTLHNVICGNTEKMDRDLDALRDQLKCHVTIFHGENDELVPVECSYAVQSKVPRAHLKVLRGKDHITMVVGRQNTFAAELEQIWKNAKGD
ncbi:probable lysophospholipase BODYGUARD 3 [Dendrobium catenatum]|uniref:Cardiolipin-specific phospholipase n=1 Tax=Dendrobium catenatum TaxID=906689 RepID=A0A2I0WF29_9ASPA|nr:probable lysophospholipase BODYGUARD 3 [Dendrobium catenatum]PKU74268.1 cardiolipin-specific phospholipase [Dendrobium catenatum]